MTHILKLEIKLIILRSKCKWTGYLWCQIYNGPVPKNDKNVISLLFSDLHNISEKKHMTNDTDAVELWMNKSMDFMKWTCDVFCNTDGYNQKRRLNFYTPKIFLWDLNRDLLYLSSEI